MMIMKRAAVAAVLLLAPAPASAGQDSSEQAFFASGRNYASALGEAYAYMESCRPDLNRAGFELGAVLKMMSPVYGPKALGQLARAWEAGHRQSVGRTCGQATFKAIRDRVRQTGDESQTAIHKEFAAQNARDALEAKAAKK
jgi:hypothetical protein